MTGILLVDKPEGTTSAGVIRALKPRLGRARVGHLGTLDPFASGLLPLCVGEATKVARYLLLERKTYTGTILLGVATDTLDRTGTVVETAPVPVVAADMLARVVERFTGPQRQTPPMYSALKRRGVPLYELARRGIEVEREARDIVVHTLALELRGTDRLDFELTCSKGTYVRVLAADVGRALGTVAHLETLRRTAVGTFRIADASALDALVAGTAGAALPLVPVRTALGALPAFATSAEDLVLLRRGQQAPLRTLPRPETSQTALLLDRSGAVAGIVEATGQRPEWRLVRLLAP